MDMVERVASWFDDPEIVRNLMSIRLVWTQIYDPIEVSDARLVCYCNFYDGRTCRFDIPVNKMNVDFLPSRGDIVKVKWL